MTDSAGQPGRLVPSKLGKYADELATVADDTDDPAVADACVVLAALGRGDEPPRDAARRVVDRAEGSEK